MSNTTTDVNAQFDGEKVAQLAAAAKAIENDAERLAMFRQKEARGEVKITDHGSGFVSVTMLTGWDKGETFTVRSGGLVEMRHGLSTREDGEVAFYGTEPAWWSLGKPVSPEAVTATDVLREAGLLWTVGQQPATFTAPDGTVRPIPDTFVNYRSDTFAPLGSVGRLYTPINNMTAFSILDELLGYDVKVKTAGAFRDFRKVFVSAEAPSRVIEGENGVRDTVRMFINIINTHDGSGSLIAAYSPWFVRCENTARLAVSKAMATYSIRHTKNGINKIVEARETFRRAGLYFDQFVAEETALANTPFTDNDLDQLILDVWGPATETKRGETMRTKLVDSIHSVWEMELARLGATAFAAENAITGHLDHAMEYRPRGDLKGNRLGALGQALLEDSTTKRKSDAHKILMQRVR